MQLLVDQITAASTPLDPIPTRLEPILARLPAIRCVLFDVYGTLMVSGVGDISHSRDTHRDAAILEVLEAHEVQLNDPCPNPGERLKEVILEHHQRQRLRGIEVPEVDIREVWFEFFSRHASFPRFESASDTRIASLSLSFELAVNPTWPMPGLASTLASLAQHKVTLGIVSNAQFFTPLLFEAYLGQNLAELGFDPSLCQWSFEHREAKPSTRLYQLSAHQLETNHSIHPDQVLYVGNDMLNDILPAHHTGFKTALFAGDQRSLRLRESDDRIREIRPDLTVTHLEQLLACMGMNPC